MKLYYLKNNQCIKKIWYILKNIASVPRFFRLYIETRVKNQNLIVGDSHVVFFSGIEDFDVARKQTVFLPYGICSLREYPTREEFIILHLGGGLAYNALEPKSTVNTYKKVKFITKILLKPRGGIVFSFGEIDIRVHIIKQMRKQNADTYIDIVDYVAERYIKFLLWVKSQKKDISVYCWGPVASISDSVIENTNYPYPIEGTELERNEITAYFNDKMQQLCDENGIIFMSIFEKLISDDCHTKTEYYSPDGTHLSDKALKFAIPVWKQVGLLQSGNNNIIKQVLVGSRKD